jgi:hypothetical protein
LPWIQREPYSPNMHGILLMTEGGGTANATLLELVAA